jgi:hypothetical protein
VSRVATAAFIAAISWLPSVLAQQLPAPSSAAAPPVAAPPAAAPPAAAPPAVALVVVVPPVAPAAPPLSASAALGTAEFHPFDKSYFLIGGGLLFPCQVTAWEIEASIVPGFLISRGLLWGGVYGTVGFSVHRPPSTRPPSNPARCFHEEDLEKDAAPPLLGYRRTTESKDAEYALDGMPLRWGGGLEGGFRMLSIDAGYINNRALVYKGDPSKAVYGLRFRGGIAVSYEAFTAGDARYGVRCCKKTNGPASETACECDRVESGLSLFVYYGNEVYWHGSHVWSDGMLGLSLKGGLGL